MNLVYTKRAVKDLKGLSAIIKPRVLAGLDDIASDAHAGKALKGPLAHVRSLRVGEYRVLYQIEVSDVIIMTVVARGSAYMP